LDLGRKGGHESSKLSARKQRGRDNDRGGRIHLYRRKGLATIEKSTSAGKFRGGKKRPKKVIPQRKKKARVTVWAGRGKKKMKSKVY